MFYYLAGMCVSFLILCVAAKMFFDAWDRYDELRADPSLRSSSWYGGACNITFHEVLFSAVYTAVGLFFTVACGFGFVLSVLGG